MVPASKLTPSEQRRRKRERIIAGLVLVVLVVFTAVEVHLLRLSAKLPFVNSIFFFGLMNVNLVLIMLLLFLVFRNAVKLILDERRGKIGSRLKTRLVFCFLAFALIPTVLLFSISAFYIKNSFDKWFNIKVGETLQRSIDVVKNYYENTESQAAHFAKKVSYSLTLAGGQPGKIQHRIREARLEYGLDGIEFYRDPFADRLLSAQPTKERFIPVAPLETLQRAFAGANECRVQNVGEGELIRCGNYLGPGKGVVFADYFIPLSLASQLSEINLTFQDFKTDNPLNYPIKSTYFAILSMVTLLILFTASWTGFYVAKRLTGPIEDLVKGTTAVANGDLDYAIEASGRDELSKLVDSFNLMVQDLKQNKLDIENTHKSLRMTTEESNHRRRYIEVLLESVQSGVVSIDENGRISMVNPAATELLGTSATELIGRPYWELIPEPQREDYREVLLSVYGNSKPVRKEIRIQTKTRDWISLLVTLSVLRDENRRQLGLVAVFENVTEIHKMERMVAWREVAKRIAHEIKNPLTPIQLAVQRLRRRYLDKIQDDGTFDQSTQIVLNEVDALKNLVSEFSAFARLPETRQVPDDLNTIIIEAVALFRAAHDGIEFQLDLDDDLTQMRLDRDQFRRVLINLFDNAIAAMQGRGTITVSTKDDLDSGLIRIEVTDQGCGIEDGAYNQLFEPYFSTKAGGTGLGLAITHRIITDHGGFVRASPNHPRGTKFVIELPDSLKVNEMGRIPKATELGLGPLVEPI